MLNSVFEKIICRFCRRERQGGAKKPEVN